MNILINAYTLLYITKKHTPLFRDTMVVGSEHLLLVFQLGAGRSRC
jgi:hypothetical protein